MTTWRGGALAVAATAALLAACGGGEDAAERIVVRGTGSGSVTCDDAPGTVVPVSFDGGLVIGSDKTRVVDHLVEIAVADNSIYWSNVPPYEGPRLMMSMMYKVAQGWQPMWILFGANGVMSHVVFGPTKETLEVPVSLSLLGATKVCRAAGNPKPWNNDPALVGDVRSIYMAIVERPKRLPRNKVICYQLNDFEQRNRWEAQVSIVDGAIRVTPPPGRTDPLKAVTTDDFGTHVSTVRRDWSVQHALVNPDFDSNYRSSYTLASSGRIIAVSAASRGYGFVCYRG